MNETNISGPGKTSTYAAQAGIYQLSPKAAEIERQVERLKAAREFCEDGMLNLGSVNDLSLSIELLQSLSIGPLPVPIAGWSKESGPSFFFDQAGFYGDLEITEEGVEYFLKWGSDGEKKEVYGTEPIKKGKFPPQLLSHLYRVFAKHEAKVF